MIKTLLLHTCCAPCLTQCLNVLVGLDKWAGALIQKPEFDISIFYDNPNISPPEEYNKRKKEVLRLIDIYSINFRQIKIVDDFSEKRREEWNSYAGQNKNEPERGKRCFFCYEFRLEEAMKTASEQGFDYIATTLTLSPYKDTQKINEIGLNLSKKYKTAYLTSDFKKNNGYRKSIELCRQYGIYRQNYCGCIYSSKDYRINT